MAELNKEYMYVVVEFTNNEIEVVSSNWIDENNICYFPPKAKLRNCLRKHSSPEENWGCYKIFRLFSRHFDSLDKALQASNVYQYTSHLESEKEFGKGKRRKVPKKFTSSENENESESSCSESQKRKKKIKRYTRKSMKEKIETPGKTSSEELDDIVTPPRQYEFCSLQPRNSSQRDSEERLNSISTSHDERSVDGVNGSRNLQSPKCQISVGNCRNNSGNSIRKPLQQRPVSNSSNVRPVDGVDGLRNLKSPEYQISVGNCRNNSGNSIRRAFQQRSISIPPNENPVVLDTPRSGRIVNSENNLGTRSQRDLTPRLIPNQTLSGLEIRSPQLRSSVAVNNENNSSPLINPRPPLGIIRLGNNSRTHFRRDFMPRLISSETLSGLENRSPQQRSSVAINSASNSSALINPRSPVSTVSLGNNSRTHFRRDLMPRLICSETLSGLENRSPQQRSSVAVNSASNSSALFNPRSPVSTVSLGHNSRIYNDNKNDNETGNDVVREELAQMHQTLKAIETNLMTLNELIANQFGLTSVPNNFPNIPIKSIEDLNNWESYLKRKENYILAASYISNFTSGNEVKLSTRNAMAYLFSNQFAKTMNWSGSGGKTSCQNLKLMQLIFSSVKIRFKDVAFPEIRSTIKEWLKNSIHRKEKERDDNADDN